MHVDNDKSPQGYIDEDIVPLLEKLHSLGYTTSSSCSGRIVLIKNPGDKSKARWLYKTHKKADKKEVENILSTNKDVWLLMEPVIIHAKAMNLGHAQRLLTAARNSGLKISGITSIKNFTLELRSTERIESLAKNADMITEANKRLQRTKDKIKKLTSALNNLSQL